MRALTAGWGQWVAAYERCRRQMARGGAREGATRERVARGTAQEGAARGTARDGGPRESAAREKCPNCGATDLRLVFSGRAERPEGRTGYAAFWCDGCLVGIHLSRCAVPDGVPMESLDTPVEQRAVRVPDYTLLWPDEDTL
jgi:hypothetical protein